MDGIRFVCQWMKVCRSFMDEKERLPDGWEQHRLYLFRQKYVKSEPTNGFQYFDGQRFYRLHLVPVHYGQWSSALCYRIH